MASHNAGTRPEDGISAAKASGVFDVVRQQYNSGDSPHSMDEDGNLRPRDETRLPHSPSFYDQRSPQGGAGAPTRPAWSVGHAAAAAADSSRSPRAPSSASADTRPWYMPPITPEDLDPQHFDDDATAGSHSAPKGRPEVHDLMYRTPGASTPKPGLQDLLYRFNGSPEEAKENNRGFHQNAEITRDAPAKPFAGNNEAPRQSKEPSRPSKAAPNMQKNPPNTTAPSPPTNNKVRLLTEGEKQLVRSIFGDAIKDLDKVEIHNHSYFPFQPSDMTVAPNGNIYLGEDSRHIRDYSKEWYTEHAKLIHEMTHVWQRQNGMHVVLRRVIKPFATYNYVIEPGKPFHKYTMEQQASIVEDYVKSLHGETYTNKRPGKKGRIVYPPAVYEALLPWMQNRPKKPIPAIQTPRP